MQLQKLADLCHMKCKMKIVAVLFAGCRRIPTLESLSSDVHFVIGEELGMWEWVLGV